MLCFRIGTTSVRLSVWFFATICVWTMMGGGEVACAVLFLFAHELGHLAVMLALGQRPACVTAIAGRFEIQPRGRLARARDEAIVLCAGVAVNLALAALFAAVGRPALCRANLALAAFNALPAGDLDGGRLLRLALGGRVRPRTAAVLHGAVSFSVSVAVMCVGFLVLLRNALNPTVFLVGVYIFVATIKNIRYES